MAKKKKKVKLRKDHNKRERLVDIEIDEISLVDKPAIEDEFIITKNVNGKKRGKAVAKKKVIKIKTAKEIQKGVFWKRQFKKDAEGTEHGEHCVLCGMSKAKENEDIGMGLRHSICFKCAVLHMEKGVLESCLSGNFDLELFKEKHPNVKIHTKAEADDDGDEDSEGDGDAAAEAGDGDSEGTAPASTTKTDPPAKDEGNEDSEEDEDESEDESEAEEDEDSEEDGDSDEDSEDESEDEDESSTKKGKGKGIVGKLNKRVKALEKSLEDVLVMLEGAAEFHEAASMMLNQQAELLVGALEMVMMLEMGEDQAEAAKSLQIKLKKFRGTVRKAGAKISAGRLQTLRDIADKLSSLIQSVAGEAIGGKTGGKKGKTKSVELESLTTQIADLKKSNSDKDTVLKKLTDRLDDLEAFGDASSELDEDEDDDSESEGSRGSVFKGFGPLKDVSDRMQKSTRTSTVGKSKA